MFRLLLPSILVAAATLSAAEPVTDESSRAQALSAAFPGMQIAALPGKTINSTWKPTNLKKNALIFPDALATEIVYRVVGKPMNDVERCAGGPAGSIREVRFQLYPWPSAKNIGAEWLAVLQYTFVNPPKDSLCTSIPVLLRLTRAGSTWTVANRFPMETHAHIGIEGIRLVDLDGDGHAELLVESDSGETDAVSSEMYVFDLAQGRFDETLEIATRMSANVMDQEQYMQVLDIPRTLKEKAKQYCFVKTTYAEEGKWFATPRSSRECYARGRGVEKK